MKLSFTKMHGAGNDFVFLNNLDGALQITKELARRLCDRRFGIGADQLLIVASSTQADFKMDIFNADGGEVEMCGNGIRCFAKYVLDKGLSDKLKLDVETLAGVIKPEVIKDHPSNGGDTLWVKVDMGEPILEAKDIPVAADGQVIDQALDLGSQSLSITAVSMGNPHAVSFVENVEAYPVEQIGPLVENHTFFPQRTNTEFIQVLARDEIKMRVWERGSGETLACGTGACGAAVACALNDKTDRRVTVHLRGGDLDIDWDASSNHVYMTGPATTVFEGEILI